MTIYAYKISELTYREDQCNATWLGEIFIGWFPKIQLLKEKYNDYYFLNSYYDDISYKKVKNMKSCIKIGTETEFVLSETDLALAMLQYNSIEIFS